MLSEFSRSNIDYYLYLIAKEYKKRNRSNPEAEIIIVGGAAVIMNYNFRDATTDIDSIIIASSNMRDVINKVGDDIGLETGWLNEDFKRTASYSAKIIEHSVFYKRFCNCLSVRTVSEEYLLAMKVRAFREYRHDKSDIVGVIKEQVERNKQLDYTKIAAAYFELYEENISREAEDYIKDILASDDLEELFYKIKDEERKNADIILETGVPYVQSEESSAVRGAVFKKHGKNAR